MSDTMLNPSPQVNVSRPTPGRMWLVCFCAGLAVIQSALGDSGASLILALTALCSAILTELLITFRTSGFEKIKDGSAAASAIVFSLLLPNQIHPVYAALGAVFAMVVVKHSFGGLGANWINPSLAGWLFIRFSWPGIFNAALEGSPLLVIENIMRNGKPLDAPLKLLKMSGTGIGTVFDSSVSSFLNNSLFSFIGAELPSGYIDLLISRNPGIIADRGLLALLLGTIVITAFQISRSWVPAAYLGLFSILVWVFGDLPFEGLFWNGDILFALFSGGTIVAAFILAAEPATGAKSRAGGLSTALLGGLLSWMFRYAGLEVYGVFFAAALVNALTPLIRFCETRYFYSPGHEGQLSGEGNKIQEKRNQPGGIA